MQTKTQKLINFFKSHGKIIRFSVILKAGFHPDSLAALEEKGKVEKIARGLYKLTDYVIGSYPDLVTASLQAPRGVVCLLSALAFYEVTNEIPKHVDLAIQKTDWVNEIKYPPIKFYKFAPSVYKIGIEEHKIEGHKIKIYNLAKTIADCFKFRNRIGIDVARQALKVAITEKGIKPNDIIFYAKICRVENIVKPIIEAML